MSVYGGRHRIEGRVAHPGYARLYLWYILTCSFAANFKSRRIMGWWIVLSVAIHGVPCSNRAFIIAVCCGKSNNVADLHETVFFQWFYRSCRPGVCLNADFCFQWTEVCFLMFLLFNVQENCGIKWCDLYDLWDLHIEWMKFNTFFPNKKFQ